jgi:hypothetical protein
VRADIRIRIRRRIIRIRITETGIGTIIRRTAQQQVANKQPFCKRTKKYRKKLKKNFWLRPPFIHSGRMPFFDFRYPCSGKKQRRDPIYAFVAAGE